MIPKRATQPEISRLLPGVKLTHRFFKDWYTRLRNARKEIDYEYSSFNKWQKAARRSFIRAILNAEIILIEMRYKMIRRLKGIKNIATFDEDFSKLGLNVVGGGA